MSLFDTFLASTSPTAFSAVSPSLSPPPPPLVPQPGLKLVPSIPFPSEVLTDIPPLCAFDLETYLVGTVSAPKIVCGSWAKKGRSGLVDFTEATEIASAILSGNDQGGDIICGAHIAYDLACLIEAQPDFFAPLVFRALREGRVHDVLIAEALHAIYTGYLGEDPRTEDDLRSEEGKLTGRYSLWNVTGLVLGRWDAKKNDAWRKSYALLDGIPHHRWPEEARQYPVDDAVYSFEVALAQRRGCLGRHDWRNVLDSNQPEAAAVRVCGHCGSRVWDPAALQPCVKAPWSEPHQNLNDLAAQTEFAVAIYLGACHGLRTDGERVEALSAAVEVKHKAATERYQKLGWIRPDGTEDQIAIKKALVIAYGATGTCRVCQGSGRVSSKKHIDCRGVKVRGRYAGCAKELCVLCYGRGLVETVIGSKTCSAAEGGCDGTGFDVANARMVARTDKGRIKADRDAKMESGNDDLHDFGVDEFSKIRNTYLPYLRKGVSAPIYFKPNPLLKSGRCSYGISDDDHSGEPIQQFPRKPLLDDDGKPIYFKDMPLGVRECVVARPGHYLSSTDYSSGELCTLAQYTKWIVGYSRMLEIINETKDPGSLHTMLGAQMLGVSFEEMKTRLKAGDKQAKEFRQAAKCFHPDTEILTRKRGWLRIADLTMEDEVASVVAHEERPAPVERVRDALGRFPPARDGHTRDWWRRHKEKDVARPTTEIVWTKPLRLTTRKATEGLVHLKNYSIDLRVTPDHEMLTYGGTKLLKVVEARDFGKQRGWFNAGMWKGGDLEIGERLLRLAVATQADGNYIISGKIQNKIRFGFSKKRKIDRLTSLLYIGEYEKGQSSNGKYKPTTWFRLSEELSTQIKGLLDIDKTLPWSWLELVPKLRKAVLDEAAFWDAHRNSRMKCYKYVTTIKKNAEVLQAISSITNQKATYIRPTDRENPEHEICHALSIKMKYDTRGENVEVTKLDYDGDVFCLTVPSGCVLVRDGGIPVITKQCGNFGLPGGLGAATLVLTNRKKGAGTTKLPDGREIAGIRFCVLIGGAKVCGVEKVTEWKGHVYAPMCRKCVEIAEHVVKRSFFQTYSEVRKYLDWVTWYTESHNNTIPQYAWDKDRGEKVVVRIRGGVGFCDASNQGFQGLLAIIFKRAYVNLTREAYLGVKEDGSPSPLVGCRFPLGLHDEPLGEIPIVSASGAGFRIEDVMKQSGRDLAPDPYWEAKSALMEIWTKDAEPVYDADGNLVVWRPSVN